jgi:hypothetical protein
MNKKVIFILMISIVSLFTIHFTHAQNEPFILITFRGLNYAPSNYPGKIVPIQNSPVAASVALLQNGKFLDISNTEIQWLINDQMYKYGVGVSTIVFQEPDFGDAYTKTNIQVIIPHSPAGYIINSIDFLPADPLAVINAPYPNNTFSSSEIHLEAIPYFYNSKNISDLNVNWRVNNQTPTNLEDPLNLDIKLPQNISPKSFLDVALQISSKLDYINENQSKSIRLIYSP